MSFCTKLKYTFLAGVVSLISHQAGAADCATFPSRIAVHHGFDWSAQSQLQLMQALNFDCREDLAVSDIAGVVETIITGSGIVVDAVEQFTTSSNAEGSNENVLNFLVSTPDDEIETKAIILPLTLTNRPIEDFVNFASLNGEPKAGDDLVLRFAVEAQVAAQFNARPFIRWKRDGVVIDDANSARYNVKNIDNGALISAELRLENAKGDILSVAEYAADKPVEVMQMPPSVIGLQLNGNPVEGQSLTVAYDLDQGKGFDGSPQASITWRRDGEVIKGAIAKRYMLSAADVGRMLSVEVTPRIGDDVIGKAARATLDTKVTPRPMEIGQKAPSLSMADVKVSAENSSANVSDSGAAPSAALTLEKVVADANKAIDASVADDAPAPPPQKPAIAKVEAVVSQQAVSSQTEQAPLLPRIALATLEDKIRDKDGLDLLPEPEPENTKPKGPPVKDLPQHLNGDRKPIDCFLLERINLESSTVVDNATRDMLMAPFYEKCTTPALIGQVMETLNNYYIDEGYVTTRAYVAPQDLRDGNLDIVIVEGRIESLQFDNSTAITQVRVDLAFPVKPGDVLNINSLERGLDQMNTPSSNKVTMNMIPGTKPGFSIIDLQEEKIGPETRIKVGLDNMGSQGTGEDRMTLGVDIDNILGVNDTWSFSHIGSLDTNAVAINGTVPSGDWTFNASYSYSDYLNYIDEATQLFGKSETMELKADRLVYKADGNELTLKSSINKKTSKRTIGDVSLKSQRMSVGRVGFGFSRKSEAVFSGNVYLAQGLKLFGAESDGTLIAEGTPRNQFTKIQFDASYYRPVFKQIYLQSALAGQISSMSLYGSEQISAGGKSSVRGFARNTIGGDSGFYIQNDFLFPMPEIITWGPLREYIAAIKPFVGIDYAYTSDRSTYVRNSIAGVGMGAKFAKGNFSGDIGIGIPIYRKEGSAGNRVEKYVKILYEALEF